MCIGPSSDARSTLLEYDRDAIDAVAQAGGRRSVWKYMA